MGMVGRWIDALPDDEKDALVTAARFAPNMEDWWDFNDDCGCVVGTVWRHRGLELRRSPFRLRAADIPKVCTMDDRVGQRCLSLARRFGHDRIVRAVKARAGADLPDMGEEVVEPTVREEVLA